MTKIKLETIINAPIHKVFDLSRNIDFHMESASHTSEKAIAGITSGLINVNETVTWKGKHLGFWLTHTSKITKMDQPKSFVDQMVQGHFKSFVHEHHFCTVPDGRQENGKNTIMIDILTYSIPFGLFGKLIDKLFIKKHLTTFLKHRNSNLKTKLEGKS